MGSSLPLSICFLCLMRTLPSKKRYCTSAFGPLCEHSRPKKGIGYTGAATSPNPPVHNVEGFMILALRIFIFSSLCSTLFSGVQGGAHERHDLYSRRVLPNTFFWTGVFAILVCNGHVTSARRSEHASQGRGVHHVAVCLE